MELISKKFTGLSTRELFEIYKLRSEVFIVEQNCAYQDVDAKDPEAIHVMMLLDKQLIGYSRILSPGLSYKEPSIGRVVLKEDFRRNGFGRELMKYSIHKTLELFKNQDIVISAQTYLTAFYTELDFRSEGEGYLEDNIPHIKMRYKAL